MNMCHKVDSIIDAALGPDDEVWCTIYGGSWYNSNNIMWRGCQKQGNADIVGSGVGAVSRFLELELSWKWWSWVWVEALA